MCAKESLTKTKGLTSEMISEMCPKKFSQKSLTTMGLTKTKGRRMIIEMMGPIMTEAMSPTTASKMMGLKTKCLTRMRLMGAICAAGVVRSAVRVRRAVFSARVGRSKGVIRIMWIAMAASLIPNACDSERSNTEIPRTARLLSEGMGIRLAEVSVTSPSVDLQRAREFQTDVNDEDRKQYIIISS